MLGPRKPGDYAPPGNPPLRADLYTTPGLATLFTVRAYREQPFAGNVPFCRVVVSLLAEMRLEYRCLVGAYCLMPDHLHFIAAVGEEGASLWTILERFKGKTTNESWNHGWRGRLWQRRTHDHVIRHSEGV